MSKLRGRRPSYRSPKTFIPSFWGDSWVPVDKTYDIRLVDIPGLLITGYLWVFYNHEMYMRHSSLRSRSHDVLRVEVWIVAFIWDTLLRLLPRMNRQIPLERGWVKPTYERNRPSSQTRSSCSILNWNKIAPSPQRAWIQNENNEVLSCMPGVLFSWKDA